MKLAELRRSHLKANQKHWRFMMISYIVLAILATVCVILHVFKIAAAIATATFSWLMIISPVLWLVCAVGYVILSIFSSREWRDIKKELKELDNE